MRNYKKVLLPVEVPIGKYCYWHRGKCRHYEFFNYNGNIPICKIGFSITSIDSEGRFLKPKGCRALKQRTG